MGIASLIDRAIARATGRRDPAEEIAAVTAECARIQMALDLRRLEAARAVALRGERAVGDYRWQFRQALARQDWDAAAHYDDLARMAEAYLPARGSEQLLHLIDWLESAPAAA